MFEIMFYEDRSGYSEVVEWMKELDKAAKNSKEVRIRLKKIYEYLEMLAQYGTRIGQPMVKHLTNTELWELRPTRDRIIFVSLQGSVFLILSHFEKKTEKTPVREIEKAKRILKEFRERKENEEPF